MVWRKQSSPTLLVGMLTGAATKGKQYGDSLGFFFPIFYQGYVKPVTINSLVEEKGIFFIIWGKSHSGKTMNVYKWTFQTVKREWEIKQKLGFKDIKNNSITLHALRAGSHLWPVNSNILNIFFLNLKDVRMYDSH